MTIGIRAQARLTLIDDADPARAWAALASGSKSLLFQFAAATESQQDELVSLGAMVTTPDQSHLAWGDVDRQVLLNFWGDEARMHVHEGAVFSVWYSRTIGNGVIVKLIDDLDD
jgi:hypothetical protein